MSKEDYASKSKRLKNLITAIEKEIGSLIQHDESKIGAKENDKCLRATRIRHNCRSQKIRQFRYWRQKQQNSKKFWETIKHHEMNGIASDYWKPYESIISKESKIDGAPRSPLSTIDGPEPTERIGHNYRSQKHIQTKAETFTVEGYNSLVRHFLTRMKKKV